MVITFLQYFGIGDVIFCQRIANYFHERGYKILWPVRPEWVEGLNAAYPKVLFVDYTKFNIDYTRRLGHEENGFVYLPIRYADSIMKVPYSQCMKSKYQMFDMNWEDWKEGSMFQRDRAKEILLMNYLEIMPGEKYCLVNKTFRQDESGKVLSTFSSELKIIEMKSIPGFSIFDWAGVIENAQVIHTVSTSIIYILELLAPLKSKIHIYIRRPDEKSHQNYDYILKSNDYVLMP